MSDSEKSQQPIAPIPSPEAPKAEATEAEAPKDEAPKAETSKIDRLRPARPPVEEPLRGAARLRGLDRASLDEEVEAAMGGFSNKDLYGEPEKGPPPGAVAGKGGEKKKATVVKISGADVFVDIPGGRSGGVLSMDQFPEGAPAIGTEIEVHIDGYDNANGLLKVSRKTAAQHADWSTVAVGMTVEARVTAVNKGGLSVEVNGIRAFMPISQIDLYRVENADQFINQKLLCVVSEVDPSARNLVVSRRTLLEREREESREKLWAELEEGQIREGIVRSIKEFGAFVDLGGVDGLLHISEMSWSRVADASTVVQPGQKLKVQVLKIDRETRKVGLGLKQLLSSPWETIVTKYPVGTVITGTVTRLMDFGAFVEIEPGVEGLIHISELSPQRVRRVVDVVQPSQVVQVRVMTVDPEQRRVGLSLKAAHPEAPETVEEEAEAEEPVETKLPRPRTTPLRGGIGSK